jgi:hypothetical protein
MGNERGVAIEVQDLLSRAQHWVDAAHSTGTVNAGFVSFALVVDDAERVAARPLVIRLRDKRVFNADDCCEGCVTNSISSLQEVRKALVDVQVGLADQRDGQLFWVLDWMLAVIRAFLTWEERVRATDDGVREASEHYRSMDRTRHTIDQLDVVRAHLRVALNAIANVASLDVPVLATARLPEPSKIVAETRHVLSKGDVE